MSNLGIPDHLHAASTPSPASSASACSCPRKARLRRCAPRAHPIVTLESQTPVREFDVLAFSVSFEWDYTNVLTMMTLAGVPQRTAARTAHDPLVMIGGAVTFVNPEPLALFADVIAAGEGEALVPPLVRAFETASDREELLRLLAAERGYYVPSFYDMHYNAENTIGSSHPGQAPVPPPSCARRLSRRLKRPIRPRPRIFTPDTEFGARLPGGGGAGLREPLPILLGRLQLPSRARVSEGADPAAGRGRAAALRPGRPGVDCPLRSPRHRGDSRTPCRDGLQHQPGLVAARRSDAHPPAVAAQERRAHHHHRAGNRVRPPAPRDQQDRDQRRDPRPPGT